MAGTLHVVATPLGNLSDLSRRAATVLQAADLVAAEDTRRARKLLNHVGARCRVCSYHAQSPPGRLDQLERELRQGASVALLSDAGTPTVSDPGAQLVIRARSCGARVIPIPGPTAVATALSVSGLPADRYTFLGFLPRKGADRSRRLDEIAASPWTVVIFEAANRLVRLLSDLATHCGADREAVVARELTKLHEEIKCGNLADLTVYYDEQAPRGEVTVLVGSATRQPAAVDCDAVKQTARLLLEDGVTRRDTAARVAREFGISRRDAYRLVTDL
ncbi:MAG: 16S rRNA (cytidine(1402)-2'-O)-methyltransferase [Gemmatimonadota bacterium]|nr:MAG: 16S rRNA (cytidine(1402)-2'-O)-methyltransferase [Gemmatimonadota bacterium]